MSQPTATSKLESVEAERVRLAITRLQALPAFFPTVQKALRLLDDPGSSNVEIQRVIASDAAVTARLLQLANSAYFGFRNRVSTVSLALTLVGHVRVATLMRRFLLDELMQMLSGRKPAARQIRELSQVTAAAAHNIAERLLRDDREEVLLAGLLHNIGELMLLSEFRELYEQSQRLEKTMAAAQARRMVFGVDSNIVGRWLLEAWELPEYFCATVEHWPDPWAVRFPAAPAAVIAMVHAGRLLAEAWIAERPTGEVRDSFSPRLLSTLEVDREFLADLYEQLGKEVDRVQHPLT